MSARPSARSPTSTTFITQRVKYIALAAGAPVNTEASCTPNIEIVFTTTPQALLDNIRKHESGLSGLCRVHAQHEKLATVTRPIQAWYTTETRDLHGIRRVDTGTAPGQRHHLECRTSAATPDRHLFGRLAPDLRVDRQPHQ